VSTHPSSRPDLAALAKRFPKSLIQQLPGKGWSADYVSWSSVQEKLLVVLSTPPSWRNVDRWHDDKGAYVTVELVAVVDGETVTVQATGESDSGDWLTAESRARCRAAALIGCGLHLWSQDAYRLDRALAQTETADEPA